MVTLTEVEDEHFQANQVGPDVDEDDFTDTGSFARFHPRRRETRLVRKVAD